jgi:tRNA-dihydrouridine synthase
MRKHMAWYLKGLKGAARVKDVIMEMTERDAMVRVLTEFVERMEEAEDSVDGSEAVSEVVYH